VLSPLPTLFARRFSNDMSTSSALKEFCTFLTTGIVISAFALPILLARAPFDEPVVSAGQGASVRILKIFSPNKLREKSADGEGPITSGLT
jgi:hypothetical protein